MKEKDRDELKVLFVNLLGCAIYIVVFAMLIRDWRRGQPNPGFALMMVTALVHPVAMRPLHGIPAKTVISVLAAIGYSAGAWLWIDDWLSYGKGMPAIVLIAAFWLLTLVSTGLMLWTDAVQTRLAEERIKAEEEAVESEKREDIDLDDDEDLDIF